MRPGPARVAVPFLLPLWERERRISSSPCPAPGALRCVLRGSPSTSSGSHLRMREVGAILPHIETHLLFMKTISAGTPSLILRCERSEPRRTHLFIATPAFASGHCQRAGKDGRPKSRSSFVFFCDLSTARLGVCPEVGRSQRPLHVHSMDKTPRVLRILRDLPLVLPPQVFTCSFQPGHAAAGRRPVSGPRVPGYHTRAGGHRRSPRSRFQNPVPQERWRDYVRGVLGWG